MSERPEILEIGQAETLTLGTNGASADRCECSYAIDNADLPAADSGAS